MLQLVNWTGWTGIVAYLQDPVPENRSHLLSVPIFFKLTNDRSANQNEVLEILRWIEGIARATFIKLMVETEVLPLASAQTRPPADDWRKVSTRVS